MTTCWGSGLRMRERRCRLQCAVDFAATASAVAHYDPHMFARRAALFGAACAVGSRHRMTAAPRRARVASTPLDLHDRASGACEERSKPSRSTVTRDGDGRAATSTTLCSLAALREGRITRLRLAASPAHARDALIDSDAAAAGASGIA